MTLTYPTQRIVLEHFEANQRFLFAARCPSIQKIDKSVPLKLSRLRFDDNAVLINDIWYTFGVGTFEVEETQEEKLARQRKDLEPGEVLLKVDQSRIYDSFVLLAYNSQSGKFSSRSRMLPAQYKDENATLKQFLSIVIGGRSEIKVVWFYIALKHQTVLKLPNNFPKLQVRNIHMYRNDITLIQHLLDPKCFPLKLVNIYSWEQAYYQNSMLSKAKCLILEGSFSHNSRTFWYGVVLTVRNKQVQMRDVEFTEEQIIALINDVIEKGRKNGTLFVLQCSGVRFLNKLLAKIENRFKGTEVTMNNPIRNEVVVSRLVAVQLTQSELVVYGVENETDKEKIQILLRVMKTGSTTTAEKKKGFSIPWFY